MFADRLIESIKSKNCACVAGLDTRLEYVPEGIRESCFKEYGRNVLGASRAILEFNIRLIDALYDIIPAVKPQSAYYEMLGEHGAAVLKKTIEHAKSKGLVVIADVKRNDIGTTAEAYSSAYLGSLKIDDTTCEKIYDADCVTVNPYFGIDGIRPFLEDCRKYGKGIFVLVKTSNKSSGELQDIVTEGGMKLYEKVAQLVDEWGSELVGKYGYSSVGAVVGATYPEQIAGLRKVMKNAYILVPGYGVQGGSAGDAAKAFNEDGFGAVVNASRSIICAYMFPIWKDKYGPEEFDAAARAEAIRMRDEINLAIGRQIC